MTNAVLGRLALTGAIVVCILGCGDSGSTVPTVPVTGTVTLGGAPVAEAVVSFSPKTDGARAAFGQTDASGRFTLTTVQTGDGAMVGSYAVTVSKTTAPASTGGTASNYDPDSLESVEAAYAEGFPGNKQVEDSEPKDLLPVKYKDPTTSQLDAEVKAEGENNFEFNLTE